MQFQGSALEKRYNIFWNDAIVSLDAKIRTDLRLGFFFTLSAATYNIYNYFHAVQNFFANITRQTSIHDCTDYAYLYSYIEQAVAEVLDDLLAYKKMKPGLTVALDILIDAMEKLAKNTFAELGAVRFRPTPSPY